MKSVISFLLVISLLVIATPVLAGEEAVAKPQIQVTIGHMFEFNEDVNGFASGIFMYDMANDYPIGFAYAGPMFSVGQANVYVLGVIMAEPIGTSAGPSLWIEANGFFLKYDHYESWLAASHDKGAVAPPASYYGLADYGYALKNKVIIGTAFEIIGYYEDDHPFEMAYGPYVKFNKFKVWLAYDETPNVTGHNYWIFRLQFGI
jgi:hypothetical protein